ASENRNSSLRKAFTFVDLSSIPGPRGRDFFKYVRHFQKDILGAFTKVYQEFGHITSFPWPMNSIIIYSPEFIKKVLVDDAKRYEKGEQIEELKAVVGNGLATNNNYQSWLRSRAIVSREFGNKAVEKASPEMERIITRRIQKISGSIDICEEMKAMTFDIACQVFLDMDGDNLRAQKVNSAVSFTSVVTYERIFQLLPLPYWIPIKKHRVFNRHYKNLEKIVTEIIDNASKNKNKSTVLSRLLNAQDPESGGKLTRSELRDEILTIMLAGHETSAHTLTWLFALLAKHPVIQEKVFREIQGLELSSPQDVLGKTPYLQLVLLETMRLYPAFPVLSRKTKVRTELGSYSIPGKTNVVIPIYVIQRSPEFWENPLEFIPERFLLEENQNSFAFLPFSRGQRRCVGEIFAMTEMTLIVLKFLQRFQISLDSEEFPQEVAAVSLKPKEKFHLVLKPRA
ncbi:MAG: cytochrome P450, partial [Bacteriovoracia bacterium]